RRLRADGVALLGRQDHGTATSEGRDDGDLVAVLQARSEAAQAIDGLAVDVDGDVSVNLALLVAHEPLEPAVRALEVVQHRAHVGGGGLDAITLRGRAPAGRGDVHGHHARRLSRGRAYPR